MRNRVASPTQNEGSLPYLSNNDRLSVYNLLIDGCQHVWKREKIGERNGKPIWGPQELKKDRAQVAFDILIPLTVKDPFFLSHLTSYVITRTENSDLKVFTTLANALSSADGTPFSVGSEYKKPNLRYVSTAALQMLDPKQAMRVAEIATMKFSVKDHLNENQHFPRSLRTAFTKYLKYREANLEIVRGIKKAGLGNTYANLYRMVHASPSDEVAAILRWQQKGKKITFEKTQFDFEGKTDLEIAKEIRKKKLPVLGVLGALKRVSPVVAVALLEQCTGNQAVILHKTFEDSGVLDDAEVKKLYEEKIATAKTALDRVETLTKESSKEVQEMMKKMRADVRKEQVGDIGKVFMHIDVSGSMEGALQFAMERGAMVAEVVKNPRENFRWGLFNTSGEVLPLPREFVADAFKSVLFGRTANGGTNAFSLYPEARRFGADVDIFCSDGAHNAGSLSSHIENFHRDNPNVPKPKACVLIHIRGQEFNDAIKQGYEESGIPVAVLRPETIDNSALVSEAIKTSLLGPVHIIDEIMSQELLQLPRWWYSV